MLDNLIQQFAGGGAQSMEGSALHGGVAQMLEAAPNEHGIGAIADALGALGGSGFGQSVQQGTANAAPQQRNGLADMLLNAVSQGGGSPGGVLSSLGIGGQSMSSQELSSLAQHVADNHPDALAGLLGSQLGSGGGGGMVSLLGNPMVRQVGMNLAQRLL
ncbi:MAG: hypothetical protein JOZ41_07105 [Chloroflexi bacterium]|nr:hypothetical protein [Chloroflexota bacterium]